MPNPTELTGTCRLRRSWWGKLVLQVECRRQNPKPSVDGPRRYWRDARAGELRALRIVRRNRGRHPLP